MRRLFCSAVLLGLTVTCNAQVRGWIADVAVIDRDSGAVLSPHYYRGEYWVAGRPGARYSIQIRNRLGERLLAVTSVDRVNVVSGATAGWTRQAMCSGRQSYQITGWRKTDAEVAAFTFRGQPIPMRAHGRPRMSASSGGDIPRAASNRRTPPAIARPDMAQPWTRRRRARRPGIERRESDARVASVPGPKRRPMWRSGAPSSAQVWRARVLYVNHGIYENADSAERGDSHSLRRLERLFAMGVVKQPPGVADGVRSRHRRQQRAGSCGIILRRTAIME